MVVIDFLSHGVGSGRIRQERGVDSPRGEPVRRMIRPAPPSRAPSASSAISSVPVVARWPPGVSPGSWSGAIVQVRRPAAGTDAAPVRLEATIDDGSQAITREFTATVQPMPSDPDQDEAYVWAFFTGEGVGGEKISLAASRERKRVG